MTHRGTIWSPQSGLGACTCEGNNPPEDLVPPSGGEGGMGRAVGLSWRGQEVSGTPWPSPSTGTGAEAVTTHVVAGCTGGSPRSREGALGLQHLPLRRPRSRVAMGRAGLDHGPNCTSAWAAARAPLRPPPGSEASRRRAPVPSRPTAARRGETRGQSPPRGHVRLRLPLSTVTTRTPGGGACPWLGQTC